MNKADHHAKQTKNPRVLAARGFFSIANQLRYGLVILVGLSILITASVLIFLSFLAERKQLQLFQQEHSRAVASEIDAYLSDLQRKLSYLARVRGLSEMSLETQERLLEGLTRHNRAYECVAILDQEGQTTLWVSPYGDMLVNDWAESALFRRTFKYGEDFIGSIELDDQTQQPFFLLGVPIRDEEDEVDGVLFAKVNLNFLWAILSQTKVGQTGYVYVIDNRNFFIGQTGSSINNFRLEDISDRPFIQELTSNPPEGLISYQGLRGEQVLGTIMPVQIARWNIIVEQPTAEAYAPIQNLLLVMGGALIISIFMAVGVGMFFSRQMVLPLELLTDAARQIRAGNLDTRVQIDRQNELGVLASTFNDMTDQLQGLIQSLEENEKLLANYNRTLEQKVSTRTKELSEALEYLQLTQRQLLNAKETAEEANRAKSAFLAQMSHELRTPLNAILGFSQLMSRDATITSEQQDTLGIINRSGEHLLSLINDVLEMSKIEAGRTTLHATNFDLHRLLDALHDMLRFKAEAKGLKLIFNRSPDLLRFVNSDESKLRQVLINLLGNAIKFTHKGNVTLSVRVIDHMSPVYRLSFEVKDSGIGIASDELDGLFEAFVQTESGRQSQQGTGLGLPISRQFVQLMDGDITVHSIVGQGSTFAFEIQVNEAEESEPETVAHRRVIGLAAEQAKTRILVVEDQSENRQLLVNLLQPLGFEIKEAINGQEGVAQWQRWQPDLIFMDMRMPICDGYEATERIKSRTNGQMTKIIALTASAFEQEQAKILAIGCDDFIAKPFRENQIFDALNKHLGVQFIYQENTNQIAEPRVPLAKTFSLPPEWLAQLEEAATILDFDQMLALLDPIRDRHPTLAEQLDGWINNFEYDEILAFTEQQKEAL